jgi:hypothetical protein
MSSISELVATHDKPDLLEPYDGKTFWTKCGTCGGDTWGRFWEPHSCELCRDYQLYSQVKEDVGLDDSCFLLSHDSEGKATAYVKILGGDGASKAIREKFRECASSYEAIVAFNIAEAEGLADSLKVEYI